MEIGSVIAENLNRLRTERNLSLGQLSALCDVSKVILSQIERGEANPTINTLWKIANGLKVPYTELMRQTQQEMQIIKKAAIDSGHNETGDYRIFCYYESSPYRNFELFQIELDAGKSYTSIGHSEKSEEYIMVLSGTLCLEVQGNSYHLTADDSISFTASTAHTYTACGEQMLRAVVINYYPT